MFDSLFVFGFDLGFDGVAIFTVLSRCMMLTVDMHGAYVTTHKLIKPPNLIALRAAVKPFYAISLPAVMT